jgi:co-chaperonin GroES (HSP10)
VIVLGHRVLIKPDQPPQESAGGILLTQDREWVATSGTVAQVSDGSRMLYHARQRALQAALEAIAREHGSTNDWFHAGIKIATERVSALLGTCEPPSDLQVGDRVAFDGDTGLRITVGDEPFLILHHDDVVVIIEEAEAA